MNRYKQVEQRLKKSVLRALGNLAVKAGDASYAHYGIQQGKKGAKRAFEISQGKYKKDKDYEDYEGYSKKKKVRKALNILRDGAPKIDYSDIEIPSIEEMKKQGFFKRGKKCR